MACLLVLDGLHWSQYLLSIFTLETPMQKQILYPILYFHFSFHIRDGTLVMTICCRQGAVPEWEITQLRATCTYRNIFSQEGEIR